MTARRDLVHAPPVLALKVASRALVGGVGGTDAAGAALGARHQRMSDCGLPNTPDFLRIDEVATLEELTVGQPGWPWVTRALAARQGFVLLAVPQMGALPAEWHEALGSMVKEVGDVTQRVCAALSDGHVCTDDGRDIDREIGEAIEKLVQLRALSRIAAGIEVEADDSPRVDVRQPVVFCEMPRSRRRDHL